MKKYIIQVNGSKKSYICDITGDPGRTTKIGNAKIFTEKAAKTKVTKLRNKYPTRSFSMLEKPKTV